MRKGPGRRDGPSPSHASLRRVFGPGTLPVGLSFLSLSLLGWFAFRDAFVPRGEEPAPGGGPVAVIVSPVRLELSPGDSIRLRVEGLDANAEAVSRIRPVWTVRPPHRASVDSTGLVIAHAEGEIVVTATVGRRSSVASGTIEPGRR